MPGDDHARPACSDAPAGIDLSRVVAARASTAARRRPSIHRNQSGGIMSGHGSFCWNELMTNDIEKAKSFYGTTIGWRFDAFPMAMGTYWVAMNGDKPAGGLMPLDDTAPPGTPPHWFSYLEVDDVDTRIKAITANGGKVLRPPFDVPTVGRIAIVQDPTGAVMGWMTPEKKA
jgi:predicted enzyme related to lactoylglutathione lyase